MLFVAAATTTELRFAASETTRFFHAAADWFRQEYPQILGSLLMLACAILTVLLFHLLIVRLLLPCVIRKNRNRLGALILETSAAPFCGLLLTAGTYFALWPLLETLSAVAIGRIDRLFLAIAAGVAAWELLRATRIVDFLLRRAAGGFHAELDELWLSLINKALRVTICVLAVFFIGQSILGLNISAMIAGAGVVGLAVALASRDTVSNIFGSLMIAMDKPFTVGQRIRGTGFDGTVEHVGFRSTRIRQNSGHIFSIPNSKIADVGLDNLSQRAFLRHTFDLNLPQTSRQQLEQTIQIVQNLFTSRPFAIPEDPVRIHYNSFDQKNISIRVIIPFHHPDLPRLQTYLESTHLQLIDTLSAANIPASTPVFPDHLS